MKAVQKHLSLLLALLSCAAAQNGTGTATVQNVTVAREGIDLRIEITLSAPVTPTVDTAENPHRILLDFPDTVVSTAAKSVPVNDNGVRRVRVALRQADVRHADHQRVPGDVVPVGHVRRTDRAFRSDARPVRATRRRHPMQFP